MADLEHLYIKTNEIWLHTVAAGPKDGPLLIFLHGFPEFWYSWKEQIPYFANLGFRVLAPDQRGYNISDKPREVSAYRVDLLAQDIVGLIQAVGHERAVIVGHDWGGGVAWWLAKQYPERVERLVIINAPHWTPLSEDLRTNPAQALRSSYIAYFQIPRVPEALFRLGNWFSVAASMRSTSRRDAFSHHDLREYKKAWSQPGAFKSMLNWYRAAVRYPPQLPENPYITVPTLILWGARDAFEGRELARGSLRMCNQGRLVLFRGATHWLMMEEPVQVNNMIRAFITPETLGEGSTFS